MEDQRSGRKSKEEDNKKLIKRKIFDRNTMLMKQFSDMLGMKG